MATTGTSVTAKLSESSKPSDFWVRVVKPSKGLWAGPLEVKVEEGLHTVKSAPLGPSKPSSGWTVEYADAFGAPIGTATGDDNTWYPSKGGGVEGEDNPAKNSSPSNENEMAAFNESQQEVTEAHGLKLTCTYDPGSGEFLGNRQNYLCGAVDGPFCCHLTYPEGPGKGQPEPEQEGYDAPLITLGKGQTLVFQAEIELPETTNEADPAFWMDGPPYGETEFDFPEFGGWGSYFTEGWKTQPEYYHWFTGGFYDKWGHTAEHLPNEPEKTFHVYTTEVYPGSVSGKYRYRVWIDGKPVLLAEEPSCYSESCGVLETKELPAFAEANKEALILQYSLRECAGCGADESVTGGGERSKGFKTGSRSMYVKNVAIYEDTEHAGVGIEHGSVAEGTTVK